jgi:hypothetical protein
MNAKEEQDEERSENVWKHATTQIIREWKKALSLVPRMHGTWRARYKEHFTKHSTVFVVLNILWYSERESA